MYRDSCWDPCFLNPNIVFGHELWGALGVDHASTRFRITGSVFGLRRRLLEAYWV